METTGDEFSSSAVRNALLILLAALLLTCYTLTHSGVFRVDDEHILMSRAISLYETGTFSDPQVYGNQRVRDLYALEDAATQVEPAQAVLAQPFLWIAALFNLGYSQILFWMTTFLTAAAAVVTAASVLLAGYERRTAIWIAILFGLGTSAAAYADTFYRDSQAMFFSVVAFHGMLLWLQRGKISGLWLFMAAAALGVLTKNNVLLLLPAWLAGLLFEYRNLRLRGDWKRIRTGFLLIGGSVLLGAAAVFILPENGPLSRFNSSYYLFLIEFFKDSINPRLLVNLFGPLISPAKSIFLFSPPLLLAAAGLKKSWLRLRGFTAAALTFASGLVLIQVLFFREEWGGGFGWGLRFLLPVIPILMVLAGAPVEQFLKSESWRRFLPALFLGVGILVNLAASVVDWHVPYRIWTDQGLNPYLPAAAWQGKFLSIPAQIAGLIDIKDWNLSWLRAWQAGSSTSMLVPVFGVVLLAALVFQLRRMLKPSPVLFRETILLGLLAGVGCMTPFFPGLWISRTDPYWCASDSAYQQALELVEGKVQPGDVIVFDSYGTSHWHCWLNDWQQPEPWYSLRYEIAGPSLAEDGVLVSELTEELFSALGQEYSRLWYVNTNQSPDYYAGEESLWLQERYQQQSSTLFSGAGEEIRVWLFLLEGTGESAY
ncbi:MAG: hypothetical protein JXA25_14845 [Anaerolineales bacterium]|nr:hypothetical protein [Anaerolineales bacterium]